jgi:chromosome segregation ATPase
MEWTLPETATVGMVFIAVLIAFAPVLRNLGGNTKEIIKLASGAITSNEKLSESIDKLNDTLEKTDQKRDIRLQKLEERMELIGSLSSDEHHQFLISNKGIIDSSKNLVESIGLLNSTISPKIQETLDTLSGIEPSINTLALQVNSQKTAIESMSQSMETQDTTLGDVLKAVQKMTQEIVALNMTSQNIDKRLLSIEETFNAKFEDMEESFRGELQSVKDDAQNVAERVEGVAQDIDIINRDVLKLQNPPPIAPDNQPVVKADTPKPSPIIDPATHKVPDTTTSETKPTTEQKKDDANV